MQWKPAGKGGRKRWDWMNQTELLWLLIVFICLFLTFLMPQHGEAISLNIIDWSILLPSSQSGGKSGIFQRIFKCYLFSKSWKDKDSYSFINELFLSIYPLQCNTHCGSVVPKEANTWRKEATLSLVAPSPGALKATYWQWEKKDSLILSYCICCSVYPFRPCFCIHGVRYRCTAAYCGRGENINESTLWQVETTNQ